MQFVTYNIQYGKGRDGVTDLARIAAEVAGADVIALQEVERYWLRSGDVDQVAELAALLPDYHWCYGAGVDLAPRAGRGPGRRRQFGNMLLARRPIASVRNHLLPKYASTGPTSLQRSALEAVLATAGGPLRVYSVHLTHLSSATRLPQVQRLLQIHRDAPMEGAAIAAGAPGAGWEDDGLPPAMPRDALLLGDFNMEAESPEYAALAGPVSDYGGRIVNPEGFVDAWVEAGHDPAAGETSDVRGRPARLDYCFVGTPLRATLDEVRVDTGATGSDHLPLWVRTSLRWPA
jgi:endonuclease/exonuclease/phosphatase family metal-dependent hydrolase